MRGTFDFKLLEKNIPLAFFNLNNSSFEFLDKEIKKRGWKYMGEHLLKNKNIEDLVIVANLSNMQLLPYCYVFEKTKFFKDDDKQTKYVFVDANAYLFGLHYENLITL